MDLPAAGSGFLLKGVYKSRCRGLPVPFVAQASARGEMLVTPDIAASWILADC